METRQPIDWKEKCKPIPRKIGAVKVMLIFFLANIVQAFKQEICILGVVQSKIVSEIYFQTGAAYLPSGRPINSWFGILNY